MTACQADEDGRVGEAGFGFGLLSTKAKSCSTRLGTCAKRGNCGELLEQLVGSFRMVAQVSWGDHGKKVAWFWV
jgi:hypothetical protein